MKKKQSWTILLWLGTRPPACLLLPELHSAGSESKSVKRTLSGATLCTAQELIAELDSLVLQPISTPEPGTIPPSKLQRTHLAWATLLSQ